jgi:hypothetical protein
MSEDLNKHRQVKSVYSKNNQINPQENKFVLCEFGQKVLELHNKYPNDADFNKYPNDADFGKQARQLILLWKEG